MLAGTAGGTMLLLVPGWWRWLLLGAAAAALSGLLARRRWREAHPSGGRGEPAGPAGGGDIRQADARLITDDAQAENTAAATRRTTICHHGDRSGPDSRR